MLRACFAVVVTGATIGALVLAAAFVLPGQRPSENTLDLFDAWLYAVAPTGAGLLVAFVAFRRTGRERWAWVLIGAGIVLWGLGEIIWVWYENVLEVEVPYPGVADVFYVLGYPVMFAGVLLLPHLRPKLWERIRLSMDALAGTVALVAVLWTLYLSDVLYLDVEAGWLEQWINLAYPLGDVVLLSALMILATRRSALQFDGRLITLGAAIAVTTMADIAYVFAVDTDTFAEGGWMALDAVWLVGYGLFAVTALLLARPVKITEQADRPTRYWQMLAPYSAILVLFGMTLWEVGDEATTLQLATATVGMLVIARQGVAIRETRDVVEEQRNDLVASISHELRTPLTAMSGFVEILRDQPDLNADERIEMIGIVDSQTTHITRIVGDLVQVARGDLDSTDLNSQVLSAHHLVESAIGMLTNGAAATQITTHIDPHLTLRGDRDRVRQVLVNYLTNAGRYGNGRADIIAHSNASEVTLEVHDDGPGVPKKYELSVWDRFERGPHRFTSQVQGSGLGLAIARQLINAHGGHTGYRRSERLGGACFWFTLPTTTDPTRPTPGAAHHDNAERHNNVPARRNTQPARSR